MSKVNRGFVSVTGRGEQVSSQSLLGSYLGQVIPYLIDSAALSVGLN